MWIVIVLLFLAGCATAPEERKDEPGQVLITHNVGYSSKIGTSEGQAAPDSDFAPDPVPAASTNDGLAGFTATTQAVLDAVAQGQGGVHCANGTTERLPDGTCRYADFSTAMACEALRLVAHETVQACAAEVTNNNCLRTDGRYQPTECPKCAELDGIDTRIAQRGCPPRERYPVLREGK